MRIDQAMARRSNNAEARQPGAEPASLPPPLQELLDQSARLRFEPDETVFEDDDPGDRVYLVGSGIVRLCKLLPDGRRTVLGFVYAGGFLNLAGGRSPGYTAEAVTAASLRCCSRSELDELIDRSLLVQRWISQRLLDELRTAQTRLHLLGRMRAVERVASFVLELRLHSHSADDHHLQVPMCRLDIADHLGLTHETVSRALTELRRQGAIALPNPQLVVVLQPAMLRAIAAEDELPCEYLERPWPAASGQFPARPHDRCRRGGR
jgi:CRP/FNR family transcriptional regulator